METQRLLFQIANDIHSNWPKPYFGAVPYLRAMATLSSINEYYGLDSGHSIVLYFLANANSWRGPEARRIKAELKTMTKLHRPLLSR
jgi:hypothetical protein